MGVAVRLFAACVLSLSAFCPVTAHVVPEDSQALVRSWVRRAATPKSSVATENDFNGHYKRFFELVKMHDACPRTVVHKEAVLGGSFAVIPHHSIEEDGYVCKGDGELTLKMYDKSAANEVASRWDHVLQHSVINSIFKQVLTSLSQYYEGSEIKGRICGERKLMPGASVLFTNDPDSISTAFHIKAPKGTKFMIVGAADMLCAYIAPGTNTRNTINVGDETILVNEEEKMDNTTSTVIPTTSTVIPTTSTTIPTTMAVIPKKTMAPLKTTTEYKTTTVPKTTIQKLTMSQMKSEARSIPEPTLAPPPPVSKYTLLQKLETTGGDFDIFLALIKMSGASTLLKRESRKFTIFAPSDEAFIKTAADFGHKTTSEKSATVFLLNLFSKIASGNPLEIVQKIVSYHILIGQTVGKDIMMKTQLDAANGQNIHRNKRMPFALIDHATNIPDAELVKGKIDILCRNGVIHVIDRVMFPFEVEPKKLLAVSGPLMGGQETGGEASNTGGSNSGGGSGHKADMKGPITGKPESTTSGITVVNTEEIAGREVPEAHPSTQVSGSASNGVPLSNETNSGSSNGLSSTVPSGMASGDAQTEDTAGKKPFVFGINPTTSANVTSTPTPSPSSSPEPTQAVSAASAYGVTASSPTPTPDSSATCFPADALVTLADGTEKPMSTLKVGERVHTGRGETTEVYAFTHADSSVHPVFVKLSTKYGSLSATASHYLHIRNRGLVAAGDVVVGDALERGDGTAAVVETLSFVQSRGLYNPQTLNGDILVNGFRASTFTTAIEPKIANALLAPVRGLYHCGAGERFLTLPYGGGRLANWIVSLNA